MNLHRFQSEAIGGLRDGLRDGYRLGKRAMSKDRES